MTKALERRGPNEKGIFLEKHCNLGHRRLSIIDIENGKQPMKFTIDEITYTIVYNGQLYNVDELRKNLIDNGFKFKGHSDTEILLKSYIFYGKEVCKHLNGIFAFAIWNSKKEELFIARDHFGIKPLYYSKFEGNFIFSGTGKQPKGDVLNHPNEFTLGFFFYNGKDKLRIVPDDPDYVVRFTQIFDDGDFYFEAYASDGSISIIT